MNWRERKDLKWGNDLTRGIPLYARTNMHPRVSTCVGLFLVLIALNVPAEADDGPLYVAPGPSNLISPDVIKRSQDQLGGTGRKLCDLIGSSLRSPTSHATDLVVTTKCGHYLSATITYADGSAKTLNLSNTPASQRDMDKAKAAIPMLRIIDIPGCSDWRGRVDCRRQSPELSVADRLLNPESVHSNKRIRIVGFKARPIAQIRGGRVVGKASTVLI